MQNEQNPSDTNSMQQPAGSGDDIQTAALLAHLAASNMFPPPPGSSYSAAPQPNPEFNPGPSAQRPFLSTANLASSSYGSQPNYPLFHGGPPLQGQHYSPPSPTDTTRGRSRAPRAPHTQAGPSTLANSPDAEEDTDEYEDKRRRNTAASARFRIKKKQRTLDLERSVSDLKGRAEELEREASDLRRENGWLKEIVMLKGGRLAGVNLSGSTGMGYPEAGRGERRGKRRDSGGGNESDSGQSDEDKAQGSGDRDKGKGKAKSKKK